MLEMEKRYSESESRAVLELAARLQYAEDGSASAEELVAAGAELGIAPKHVMAAIAVREGKAQAEMAKAINPTLLLPLMFLVSFLLSVSICNPASTGLGAFLGANLMINLAILLVATAIRLISKLRSQLPPRLNL